MQNSKCKIQNESVTTTGKMQNSKLKRKEEELWQRKNQAEG